MKPLNSSPVTHQPLSPHQPAPEGGGEGGREGGGGGREGGRGREERWQEEEGKSRFMEEEAGNDVHVQEVMQRLQSN